jgi:hypothetical protein
MNVVFFATSCSLLTGRGVEVFLSPFTLGTLFSASFFTALSSPVSTIRFEESPFVTTSTSSAWTLESGDAVPLPLLLASEPDVDALSSTGEQLSSSSEEDVIRLCARIGFFDEGQARADDFVLGTRTPAFEKLAIERFFLSNKRVTSSLRETVPLSWTEFTNVEGVEEGAPLLDPSFFA